MAIPEAQLDTWSHQGSITQSSATYNSIKNVLEASGTRYAAKSYDVFLQGSYGNDTNIYAESDVDIVIRLDDTVHSDLSDLTPAEKGAWRRAYPAADYPYADFKRDVLKVLTDKYGRDVKVGDKAIQIAANASRRSSDVIVATQYRRYHKFNSVADEFYVEGICFWDNAGTQIVNYPKQHAANCTTKHQGTGKWFKPLVRVVKNMRGYMVDNDLLEQGVAASYYLEGLLYNVPNERFSDSYETCFVNGINWIQQADKSKFVCANEQYYLLHKDSPVTWRSEKCDKFLDAVTKLWNNW
jgi:hypothetical protein